MECVFKEFLKSLCDGSQWSYVVFWKADGLNSRILVWDDCFWDSTESMGTLMQQILNNHQFYVVGEGVVGWAALTGRHEWLLLDGVIHLQLDNELHNQYSAGVKTVVVVPHSSVGTVLLGSTSPIAENRMLVDDIRSMLIGFQSPSYDESPSIYAKKPLLPPVSRPPTNSSNGFKQADEPGGIFGGSYDASVLSQQCSYFPMEYDKGANGREKPISVDFRAHNISKISMADDLYGLIGLEHGSQLIEGNLIGDSGPILISNNEDDLLDAVVAKAAHSVTNTALDVVGSSGKAKDESCSSTPSSALTSWVSYSGKQESSSLGLGNKCDESRKASRKRENPRPRPKDRQMIQDRVKELREIVPNGVKCSIDALLERTIKHMLFLQSVTKHEDKLKLPTDSKLLGSLEGGKTWAYEVGAPSTFCPIVVQDLNSPRLLVVEIMCEERGFFLEIADLIRGMGLTIMKGAMECRSGQIFAQFAVEADRDVTRREVFMSLVHLLEQLKCDKGNSTESESSGHSAFFPLTSIPATGGASFLH